MISIVIPARNEEENIERLLQSISENDYSDYEVILVDGGSKDETRSIARSYDAKVIDGPRKGTGAARNKGWRAAKGDIIYFLDADWFISENVLQEIHRAFEEKDIEFSGVQYEHVADTWVSKAVSAENNFRLKLSLADIIEKILLRVRK